MEQREAVGMDVQHAQRTLDEAQGHQRQPSPSGATRRWPTSTRPRRAAAATGRRSSRTSRRTCSPSTTAAVRAAAPAPRSCASAAAGRAGWSWTGRRSRRCGRHRPDEVVYCEECGTVLVRTPQSGSVAMPVDEPEVTVARLPEVADAPAAGGRGRRARGRGGLDRPGRGPDPPAAAASRPDRAVDPAPLLRARRPRADRAGPRPGRRRRGPARRTRGRRARPRRDRRRADLAAAARPPDRRGRRGRARRADGGAQRRWSRPTSAAGRA